MSILHWQILDEEVHILAHTLGILLRRTRRPQSLSNDSIVLQRELECL
jgi:hypothetical protein